MDSAKVLVQAEKQTYVQKDQYSHIGTYQLYIQRQTYRQTDRQTDRQDRQKRMTNRQTDSI
jgi:hypothetical protein